MSTNSTIDPETLPGTKVVGTGGAKLGEVSGVYLDNETSKPEWAAVTSGLFGTHVSLVPLAHAEYDGTELTVPYDKDQLKSAPHHDPGQALSETEEAELFEHYGVPYGGDTVTEQTGGQHDLAGGQHERRDLAEEPGVQGRDTSGPTTDEAMTRSEEQLHVGTEKVEAGRARLRKYVVTEQVTTTVPVSHEEVRLEREPITEGNRDQALSGTDISEEEHEITLHAERPVVSKETVPVERVRLGTETVTEQHEVTEQVRKEQIDEPTTTE